MAHTSILTAVNGVITTDKSLEKAHVSLIHDGNRDIVAYMDFDETNFTGYVNGYKIEDMPIILTYLNFTAVGGSGSVTLDSYKNGVVSFQNTDMDIYYSFDKTN